MEVEKIKIKRRFVRRFIVSDAYLFFIFYAVYGIMGANKTGKER